MRKPIPECFGLKFLGYSIEELDYLLLRDNFEHISTVNAEFIVTAYENNDDRFLNILKNSICTMDGEIPLWIAKLVGKETKLLNKVSGSSYSTHLLELCAEKKLKVFFLGGNSSSIESLLNIYPDRNLIDAYSPKFEDYPFSQSNTNEIRSKLSKFKPDVLLVGFGAQKQEFWIDDNKSYLESIGVRASIGVGGTFEFLSGGISRAPELVQKLGLESIYRLAQQPSLYRIKRIIKSLKVFLYINK